MLDAEALIKKHRAKGVFVDTNLFVLLLVGWVNVERIPKFNRTQSFTVDDFYLLQKLINWFGAPLIASPYVLSQVSDLTRLSGNELTIIRELFKATVEAMEERYDSAKQLVQHSFFERFGLADASVAAACQADVLVLTADLQLQVALGMAGRDALNFNHVRVLGWSFS